MASIALVKLVNRSLLRISGPDCYPYLQGLLSNDVRYLYEPERIPKRRFAKVSSSAICSFMLNAQGRAICDMILYRTPSTRCECKFTPPGQATEPDELLIECDSSLASGLANTLFGYRVRRKIKLAIEDRLSVWCLFPKLDHNKLEEPHSQQSALRSSINNSLDLTNEVISDSMTVVNDPRIINMGLRIITDYKNFNDVKRNLQSTINETIIEASIKDYTSHRHMLGVGEGPNDHPESSCLPLEANADLLGAVSFTKGCYLGQELTSRIHYTGVVRKRLMPVTLDLSTYDTKSSNIPLINGSDIIIEGTTKKVGIMRSIVRNRALALIRHEMLQPDCQLIHEGSKTKMYAYKPYWWTI